MYISYHVCIPPTRVVRGVDGLLFLSRAMAPLRAGSSLIVRAGVGGGAAWWANGVRGCGWCYRVRFAHHTLRRVGGAVTPYHDIAGAAYHPSRRARDPCRILIEDHCTDVFIEIDGLYEGIAGGATSLSPHHQLTVHNHTPEKNLSKSQRKEGHRVYQFPLSGLPAAFRAMICWMRAFLAASHSSVCPSTSGRPRAAAP